MITMHVYHVSQKSRVQSPSAHTREWNGQPHCLGLVNMEGSRIRVPQQGGPMMPPPTQMSLESILIIIMILPPLVTRTPFEH